jgi:hypothetical protein
LGSGDARKRPRRQLSCPGIEALEGRVVLSTFKADNLAKLREAIVAVNFTPGPNTIFLEGRAYRDLPNTLTIQNAGNLTILGSPGKKGTATTTQLVGPVNGPVFKIINSNVTISGILMSGTGITQQGGVIDSENSDLTVEKSTVNDGAAVQAGGGIFAEGGTLNIADSSIVNNLASGANNSFGGGIATVNTNVNISYSKVNNNTLSQINNMDPAAGALASGGGLYAQGGTVNISHTNLSTNRVAADTSGTTATASGGGFATVNATVTVDHSTIENNTLNTIASQVNNTPGSVFSGTGGSVTVTNAVIKGNLPTGNSEFAQAGAPVILQDSTVDDVVLPGKYVLGDNGFTPET